MTPASSYTIGRVARLGEQRGRRVDVAGVEREPALLQQRQRR